MMSAAELLVERAALAAQRRIAWLASAESEVDVAELEWEWHKRASLTGVASEIDDLIDGEIGAPWRGLVRLFGLSSAEADLLSLAIAQDAEPALASLFAQAQDSEPAAGERSWVSEPLARRLFGHGPEPIWRPSSPLAMWSMLEPRPDRSPTGRQFRADSRLTDLMFGVLALSEELLLAVESVDALPIPEHWPVRETAERVAAALDAGASPRTIIVDVDEIAQVALASHVATHLGRDAIVVDGAALAGPQWARAFMLIQRFALLGDLAVIWRAGGPAWPRKIPLAPYQFVLTSAGAAPADHDGSVDLVTHIPALTAADRTLVWTQLNPSLSEHAEAVGQVTSTRLGDLVLAARKPMESLDDIVTDLRAQARTRMGEAGRIVDPSVHWDDLVLADDAAAALRRVSFEARTRSTILQSEEVARLFRSSAGLSALFWGPPGVGKSMAAEVIAHDLGVNLLVVDLAATMSKYIGETAKNLSAVFAEAKASGAALIFEEADTFFAKRTGGREVDHYRNGDTNHLLQLLDGHDALVMLSTNDRSSIDPAFIRRIRHVIEFPMPGPGERRELWDHMLGVFSLNGKDLAEAAESLADAFSLSPAQIKSATLTASYAAAATEQSMTYAQLEEACVRELIKEGRPGVAVTGQASAGSRRRNGGSRGTR